MRTRYMRMRDYGIDEADAKRLLVACRTLSKEESEELLDVAKNVCDSAIAERVWESLTTGASYNTLDKKENIPLKIDDFYAYRRKVLATFYKQIQDAEDVWRISGADAGELSEQCTRRTSLIKHPYADGWTEIDTEEYQERKKLADRLKNSEGNDGI